MIINRENKLSSFFSRVYLWMFVGLLISGGVAYYTSVNLTLRSMVYNSYLLLIILELIVVFSFTCLRKKVSPNGAKVLFIIYSILSGLTLSSIFIVYKIESIGMVFLSSGLMFGLLAIYGFLTKNDLTFFGKIFIFALIAIIVMSVINMFVNNSSFGIMISIISVVLFLGLTAWDMQKLKGIYSYYQSDEDELIKASIYGALDLYLDFVNIFLHLLNLFGRRND